MKTIAAVLVKTGQPLEIAELDIPVLKPGQVLVEIAFSGVCHTQVLEVRGYRGPDAYLPHCLGHEGSGLVKQVGPGVTKVKVDDRVILSWIKGTGHDVPGTVYRWENRPVNAGAITTFSRYAVISENRLTVMPPGLPLPEAALLGCAMPTGLGAIFNTAPPQPGDSAAIFGTGGVGLFAVAGAALFGCWPVIAVDIQADKLALAGQLGATHLINVNEGDPVEAVKRIAPGGVDLAIEASGKPAVMRQALASVRNQGGIAVVIGNARHGETLELDPRQFNMGKQVRGTWGGDSQPDKDFVRFGRLMTAGKLNVGPIISQRYSLENINQAIDDLESGKVIRPLIEMATGW